MGMVSGHFDQLVQDATQEASLLDRLSDQMVPVMMRIPLDHVSAYKQSLLPLLDSLDRETEAYGYLVIVVSFFMYRESLFIEAIDILSEYGVEYEDQVTIPIRVGVNTLIGASYRSLGQTEFAWSICSAILRIVRLLVEIINIFIRSPCII